ncbi:hypothetical protein [Burkholderia ubonensis]|uniref:hypothetical protein n=1 Tax=Burkholderia ubonensis TaxID=101571 RepID=UPI001E512CCD|nr:hypothetical protein [Burkholderia ubonensis]
MNCVVAAEVAKRHNAGRCRRGKSCASPGPAGETSAANPLQAARLRVGGAYATAFRSRPPRFLRGKTNLHQSSDIANPPPETLLRIIAAQTEIARLGLDLGSVMAYVADQAMYEVKRSRPHRAQRNDVNDVTA